MFAAIVSEELRMAGSFVNFKVDENSYNPENERVVSKKTTLDGTVITTDWGAPEGSRIIRLAGIHLTRDQYELLIAFKEAEAYNFLYCYINSTWKVIVQRINGQETLGKKMLVQIALSVIEKYSNGETG